MLRGIMAAIAACVVFALPFWLLYMYGNDSTATFFNTIERKLNIAGEGLTIVLVLILSFLSGVVSRLISRGRFYWSAVPFLIGMIALFVNSRYGDEYFTRVVFNVIIILVAMLILMLPCYWGWKMIKNRQEKKE